jgi:hypothetical protein
MVALLHHTATTEDHNVISFADGRETMCNHDSCAALACAVQGCLHDLLAVDVDGGGSLVKDQDLGLLDDGACDGDALALAAAQFEAGLSNDGIIALQDVR